MFTSDLKTTTPAPWSERQPDLESNVPAWIVRSSIPAASEIEELSSLSTHAPAAPQTEAPTAAHPITTTPAPSTVAAGPLPPSPVMEPQRDYEGELAQLQEQLAGAIRSIAAIRRELLQASERDVVELALVIAEKVTARELTIDPSLVASWARAGLEALADQDAVEIAVAPDIAAAVPPEAWTDADGAPIAPIVDPKLKPGSCDVRGELSRCDASVSARLNSVRDAIGANGVDE